MVSVMRELRTYPHGVTSWIDTEQPDLEAARAFYAGLFGWTFADPMSLAGPESYLIATMDDQDVAAIASTPAGAATWNTYIAVTNADSTAAAVTASGGALVGPPEDAGQAGRTARCTDPFGAEFRLWQAGRRLGAQRTNVPGTWNFSELYTPDREAAMAFYTPLFGWRATDLAEGAGTMLQVPGYGDHLAATVDPGIHAAAGFGTRRFRRRHRRSGPDRCRRNPTLARHVHRGRPRRQRRYCAAAWRHGRQARPTTCGPESRSCATRRAPTSLSASSPLPAATGNAGGVTMPRRR